MRAVARIRAATSERVGGVRLRFASNAAHAMGGNFVYNFIASRVRKATATGVRLMGMDNERLRAIMVLILRLTAGVNVFNDRRSARGRRI